MNMSLVRFFIYLASAYFFTNLGNVAELSTEKQALYYLLLLAVFVKIELRLIPNAEQLVGLIMHPQFRVHDFFPLPRQNGDEEPGRAPQQGLQN